jgi:tetratricopeptide (TPR) repeat protein
LGPAWCNLNRDAEAREKYAKAVAINPRDANAYVNWGVALARMGKTAEAIEKLDKAVALDPSLKGRVDDLRREFMGGK